jgi:Tfp pilus assembly protein PilN
VSQQINLFNPIFLQQEKQFSAVTMAQGLGIVVLAVLAFAGYSTWQSSRVANEAKVAASQLKAAQENLVKMVDQTKPIAPNKSIEDDIARTESRLRAGEQILAFVQTGDFRSGRSYSGFLRAFSNRTMPGVWLTGVALGDGGNDIAIDGRALQANLVTAYIRSLKGESAFTGKSFGSLVLRAPPAEAQAKPADGAARLADGTARPAPPRYIEFSMNSSEASTK